MSTTVQIQGQPLAWVKLTIQEDLQRRRG